MSTSSRRALVQAQLQVVRGPQRNPRAGLSARAAAAAVEVDVARRLSRRALIAVEEARRAARPHDVVADRVAASLRPRRRARSQAKRIRTNAVPAGVQADAEADSVCSEAAVAVRGCSRRYEDTERRRTGARLRAARCSRSRSSPRDSPPAARSRCRRGSPGRCPCTRCRGRSCGVVWTHQASAAWPRRLRPSHCRRGPVGRACVCSCRGAGRVTESRLARPPLEVGADDAVEAALLDLPIGAEQARRSSAPKSRRTRPTATNERKSWSAKSEPFGSGQDHAVRRPGPRRRGR